MLYSLETCPLATKHQLNRLTATLSDTLKDTLIGIYLHGSLAMAAFNPERSDLDCLVITRQALNIFTKARLAAFLLELSKQPHPIEISFLHFDQFNPWRHPCPFDFHYSEMWRSTFQNELESENWQIFDSKDQVDPDLAAHIMVLNKRGRSLMGRPISELFANLPPQDYLDAIKSDVQESLKNISHNPLYAVLNACRTCAFIQDGEVLSKKEGGEWALKTFPEAYHLLISKALDDYQTNNNTLEKDHQLSAFADFVQQMLLSN